MTPKKRGGSRLPVYDESGNLIKKGAGRIAKEKTVTTGFRIHEDSLNIIRAAKYPINAEVNKLVKNIAKEIIENDKIN